MTAVASHGLQHPRNSHQGAGESGAHRNHTLETTACETRVSRPRVATQGPKNEPLTSFSFASPASPSYAAGTPTTPNRRGVLEPPCPCAPGRPSLAPHAPTPSARDTSTRSEDQITHVSSAGRPPAGLPALTHSCPAGAWAPQKQGHSRHPLHLARCLHTRAAARLLDDCVNIRHNECTQASCFPGHLLSTWPRSWSSGPSSRAHSNRVLKYRTRKNPRSLPSSLRAVPSGSHQPQVAV